MTITRRFFVEKSEIRDDWYTIILSYDGRSWPLDISGTAGQMHSIAWKIERRRLLPELWDECAVKVKLGPVDGVVEIWNPMDGTEHDCLTIEEADGLVASIRETCKTIVLRDYVAEQGGIMPRQMIVEKSLADDGLYCIYAVPGEDGDEAARREAMGRAGVRGTVSEMLAIAYAIARRSTHRRPDTRIFQNCAVSVDEGRVCVWDLWSDRNGNRLFLSFEEADSLATCIHATFSSTPEAAARSSFERRTNLSLEEVDVLEERVRDGIPHCAMQFDRESYEAALYALDRLLAALKAPDAPSAPPAGKPWVIPDFGDQIRQSVSDRDFRSWFVFEAMSAFKGEGLPRDFVGRYFPKDGSMPGEVSVELRVNGQLTDAEAVFKHMRQAFETSVIDEARHLLEQKLGKVGDLLETFRRETTHAMRSAYPDAHYSDDDND